MSRVVVAMTAVLLLVSGAASARTSLTPDLYSVNVVEDQGFSQLEFIAHKRMLLITEPVDIPIPFKPSDSFRVAVDRVNTHIPEFVGEALPVATRASGYGEGTIQRGDFDGDGFSDLFVVAENWRSVFIVMGTDEDIPSRVLYFSEEDISRFQSGYTLSSVNGDGVTDIYFTSSDVAKTVYNISSLSDSTYPVELERIGVFYDESYLALRESSLTAPAGLFYSVNELTGNLLVSQSIDLPLAKGVMPQLNVSYSSDFSVGGREWSINPVSKIEVCYEKDGNPEAELKKNLCLDGRLLTQDSESGKYLLLNPVPGSYAVITDLGNGKYKLDDGAGTTRIYGESSSRFGKVSYISGVTGVYGEKIDYNYSKGLLDTISYGTFEVSIKYAEVDDSLFHIDGYSKVSSSLGALNSGRLQGIEVKENGKVISRRDFFYEKGRAGRMISMQQCYYSPDEECEEPYYFDYKDGYFDRTEYSLGISLNEFKAADFTSYSTDRISGGNKVDPVAVLGKVTRPVEGSTNFLGYKVSKFDFGSNSTSSSSEYAATGGVLASSYSSDATNFSLGLTNFEGRGDTGDSGYLIQGYIGKSGQTCRNGNCTAIVYTGDKVRLIESHKTDDFDNFNFIESRNVFTPEPGNKQFKAASFHRNDVNRDGEDEFFAAFTSYHVGNYFLSLEKFGKRTPSPISYVIGEAAALDSQGFDPSDISIYGPFDLDYDGVDEVYVRLSLNKGYMIDLDQNGYARFGSITNSSNFGIITNTNLVYGDFNGDGLLDAVSTSGDNIKYYSGIYRVGSTVKYGRVSDIGSIPSASVTIDGATVPNILPLDYDRDGKDELWVAGSFYSIRNNQLEQDPGVNDNTFTCRSVECMKIVDYDHDSVPDLVEWRGGKIVTHGITAQRNQISSALYDGKTLFQVDYSDVSPALASKDSEIRGRKSYYATDSISTLKKQKVSALFSNNGSKGWVKKLYTPKVAAYGGIYSGYGYAEVEIDKYSTLEVSSTVPAINEHIVSDDVFGRHFRGEYYINKVDRSYLKDGIVDSVVSDKVTSLLRESGSDYKITKTSKDSVLGPYTEILSERVYLVDKFGRIKKEETNGSGAEVEISHLYENPDWPSFVSQTTRTYVEAEAPYIDITKYQPLPDKPLLWKANYHVGNQELEFQEERQYHSNYDVHKVISSVNDSLIESLADRTMVFTDYDRGLPKVITQQHSGLQVSKTYDLYGRTTSESSNGHEVTYAYDALGRLLSEADNTGLSVSYSYENCAEDCMGDANYIAISQLSSGAIEKLFLDINGFRVGKHHYNEATGTSTYSMSEFDNSGRLSKEYRSVESFESDLPSTYEYYSYGALKKSTEPGPLKLDGTRIPIETDFTYERTEALDSSCGTDIYCIKKTTTQSAASLTISDEPIETPERTSISYIQMDSGRTITRKSPGGTTKVYGYDVFGNISSIKESGDFAGGSSNTNKQLLFNRVFNVNGMMVASERPGRGVEYKAYSPFGEILKETYASGSTVSYVYDGAGRIKSKVYSGTGELQKRSYSWVYDIEKKGLLDEIRFHDTDDISSWTSVYEYDYDEYGRPESERNQLSSVPLNKSLAYNLHGLPDSLSMSATGVSGSDVKLVSSYQGGVLSGNSLAIHNSESDEEELQPLWSVSQWDFKGRKLSIDYFGASMTMDVERDRYNSTILSKSLSHADLGILDGEDVYFDTHGDPRLKVGIEGGETTESLVLSYDQDQRLTSVNDRVGLLSASYSMDDFGNFNYKNRASNVYGYDLPESAALSSVDSGSITYSKLVDGTYTGHMSEVGGYVLTHNEKGQPSSISGADSSVTFTYGPFDELVAVNYSGGETLQLWGDMQVSTGSEYGTFYRYRVGDVVLIRGDVEGDFITYKDYLGSERSIWNSAGELVSGATYDAYGKKVLSTSLQGNGFVSERGYTSHLELKGFPFVHMKNRLYSPEFGLFTSMDPVFDSIYRTGGLNGYGYVSGSPYRSIDPSGMVLVDINEYEMSNVSGAPNFEQWAQDLVNNSMSVAPVVNVDNSENVTIEVNVSDGLDTAINSAEEILGNPLPGAIATTGSLILATNNSVLTNSGTRIPTLPLTYGMDIESYNKAVGASKNLYITGNVLGYAGFTLSTYQYIDAVDSNDWDRARKVSTTAFYSALMMSPPWLITIPVGMTGIWVTNNDGSLIP